MFGCCDTYGEETTMDLLKQFVYASFCMPCAFGEAMQLSGNGNAALWGLQFAFCGPCGIGAIGSNTVNETLGGDDLCLEYGPDYLCCCCCSTCCAVAELYRATKREFKDKDDNGVGDYKQQIAPPEIHRDELLSKGMVIPAATSEGANGEGSL